MIDVRKRPRVAEFFAGIGLVRMAVERHGCEVVWANDIENSKLEMYRRNFDASHFFLGDICDVQGDDIPNIDLATASFPCTDLSLAGNRKGLQGSQSGTFWEFARVLREMDDRRPVAVLLENVPSFATSNGGHDLILALEQLNDLGYWCDLLVVNARHFVAQSRPRLFIVGTRTPLETTGNWQPSDVRPAWIARLVANHPDLRLQPFPIALPPSTLQTLPDVVERLSAVDAIWWNDTRRARFLSELSPTQQKRLDLLMFSSRLTWATAYRRTRNGKPAWEIRADAISGCLRTARGGSSKQALVEAGAGAVRVRWMTAREYARLQGADHYNFEGVPDNQAMFGFGDAVCVPAVAWLVGEYLMPLLDGKLTNMPAVREECLLYG